MPNEGWKLRSMKETSILGVCEWAWSCSQLEDDAADVVQLGQPGAHCGWQPPEHILWQVESLCADLPAPSPDVTRRLRGGLSSMQEELLKLEVMLNAVTDQDADHQLIPRIQEAGIALHQLAADTVYSFEANALGRREAERADYLIREMTINNKLLSPDDALAHSLVPVRAATGPMLGDSLDGSGDDGEQQVAT